MTERSGSITAEAARSLRARIASLERDVMRLFGRLNDVEKKLAEFELAERLKP